MAVGASGHGAVIPDTSRPGMAEPSGDLAKMATEGMDKVAQLVNEGAANTIKILTKAGETDASAGLSRTIETDGKDKATDHDKAKATERKDDQNTERQRTDSQHATTRQHHAAEKGARGLADIHGGLRFQQQANAENRLGNLIGESKVPTNINSSAGAEAFITSMNNKNAQADSTRADTAADNLETNLGKKGIQLTPEGKQAVKNMLKLRQQLARMRQAQNLAQKMGEKGEKLNEALDGEIDSLGDQLAEAEAEVAEHLPKEAAGDLQEAKDEVEQKRAEEDGDDAGQTGDKKDASKTATKEAVDSASQSKGDSEGGSDTDTDAGTGLALAQPQPEAVPIQESLARTMPIFSSGAGGPQGAEGELDAHANVVGMGLVVGGRVMVDPQSGEIRRVKGAMERGRNPSDPENYGKMVDPEGVAAKEGLAMGTGIRPGEKKLTRGKNTYVTSSHQIRRCLAEQPGKNIVLPNGQTVSRAAALVDMESDATSQLAMCRGRVVDPNAWYHNADGFA